MPYILKSAAIVFAGALALSACAPAPEPAAHGGAAAQPASNVTAHGTPATAAM